MSQHSEGLGQCARVPDRGQQAASPSFKSKYSLTLTAGAFSLEPDMIPKLLAFFHLVPVVTHPDGKRFYRDHLDRWMPL